MYHHNPCKTHTTSGASYHRRPTSAIIPKSNPSTVSVHDVILDFQNEFEIKNSLRLEYDRERNNF